MALRVQWLELKRIYYQLAYDKQRSERPQSLSTEPKNIPEAWFAYKKKKLSNRCRWKREV